MWVIARAGTRSPTRSNIAASTTADSSTQRFAPAALERCAAALLEALGVAPRDAACTADLLVASDLADHPSHGLLRLPAYLEAIERGEIDPRGVPRVIGSDGATATIDGGRALGQVVGRIAADEAVARARRFGVSCVVVRRSGHVGRLAAVAERLAREGQIGIVTANDAGAGQTVAPPGAREARLSTNPLAIAAPRASGGPFSLDMATSVVSHGTVRVHRERGRDVPGSWEQDGLLQLLGGYKGLGLALAVEILAGVLSQAGHSNAANHDAPDVEQGMTLIAIDVAHFRPLVDLAHDVDELVAHVRSAPVPAGAEPIAVPGERGHAATRRNRQVGVALTRATVDALWAACVRLGVPPPVPVSAGAARPPR